MTYLADDAVLLLYRGFVTDRYNLTMITTGTYRAGNNATAPIDYQIGPSMWGGQQTRIHVRFQDRHGRHLLDD